MCTNILLAVDALLQHSTLFHRSELFFEASDTATAEKRRAKEEEEEFTDMINALSFSNSIFPHEAKTPEIVVPKEDTKHSKIKKTSGGLLSITYNNWKPMYTDEYTGGERCWRAILHMQP